MSRRDRLFVLAVVGLTVLVALPVALLRPLAEERAALGTAVGWGLAILIMVPNYMLLSRALAESNPHRFVAASGGSHWLRLRHERDLAATHAALTNLLARQAEAWSRGDLDAFVEVYAEDATFLAPTGIVQGREAVRARYAALYPDPSAMGTLRLEVVEMRPVWGVEPTVLGESEPGEIHGAGIVARWTLTPATGESASGTTLLLFRREAEGWRIVQDASM